MKRDEAISSETVYGAEYELIARLAAEGKLRSGAVAPDQLMGLAFSGGGIRSATFNLGVLQALAELELLREFDYLSTVSGGGYIGSWLTAWIAREDAANRQKEADAKTKAGEKAAHTPGIENVQRALDPSRDPANEAEPIRFLRSYSNYLTPQTGLSTDTLAGVATYLRNFILNLVVLCGALSVVLLVPRLAAALGLWLQGHADWTGSIGVAALLVSVFFINLNLATQLSDSAFNRARLLAGGRGREPCYIRLPWVIGTVIVPLVVAALMLSCWLAASDHHLVSFVRDNPVRHVAAALAAVPVVIWITWEIALRVAGVNKSRDERPTWWWRLLGLVVGSAVGVGGLVALQEIFAVAPGKMYPLWHATVWAPPGLVGVFGLAAVFVIGTSGRQFEEDSREWWSRVGGILIAVAAVWIAVAAAAVYGPWLALNLPNIIAGVGLGWMLTTIAGVRAAMSSKTGAPGSNRLQEIAAQATPLLFIAGLLLALSFGIHAILDVDGTVCGQPGACHWQAYAYGITLSVTQPALWIVLAVSAAITAFFSWRVDVNVFSFHMFYRNRLVRCYLGASNPKRKAHPFTGFDGNDSPKMMDLAQRPYHLVNTAMNITAGKRLAWQERKAASFVFSPLYCGYDLGGHNGQATSCYQPTETYVRKVKGSIGLGSALAISGAAASPNMGYHSKPSVAFLLTVFNLRLGWWMQNPAHADVWENAGPGWGFRYLLAELFGATDESTSFVYLSDGGHFDNLGIYELVKRRCRFIVVSDAGCDPNIEFEDLGNAIRKCQIDLGVSIDIDARVIVPDPATGRSLFHCAVGIIRYPGSSRTGDVDSGDGYEGYLLYLKPSLSGNEPRDVLQYAAAHPEFPHESTSDQWFAESQFESYRKLGYHIAAEVFRRAGIDRAFGREAMFVALKQKWYPPSAAVKRTFSRHTEQLKALHEQQRSDADLRFLDLQIYPEWNRLMEGKHGVYPSRLSMPAKAAELRAGFYFCSNLLGLMESVYIDLDLEDDFDHPDNRGWINLFKHWSWSTMFRATYAVCCATYGARFQTFCRTRLELSPGAVLVSRTPAPDSAAGLCHDADALSEYLHTAQHQTCDLNFEEVRIIREVASKYHDLDELILLRLRVADPSRPGDDSPSACALEFSFGFALTNRKHEYVCLRVQDHLRGMGLARRALQILCADGYTAIAEDSPVPDDEQQRRFRDLLASVLREQGQGAAAIEAESER
jgi:hypothetical protein